VSKSVSIRPMTLAMRELETGPLHRFQDWPNGQVPKRAAGVYTVWDGDRLLYVGRSGRAMTAEDLEVSAGDQVGRAERHRPGRPLCHRRAALPPWRKEVQMADWGPFDLSGKNAVVTGGAMGIGHGIVRRFVEAGANVVVADLDGEAAATVAGATAGRGRAVPLAVDVGADDAGQAMVSACVEAFGAIDVLVNNAGIYPMSPMLETTQELFDRVYRVNLRGLAFASKAAAARMIQQGAGGKIVNIASVNAFHPMVGLAAYDASKGGVVMLTKALALEFGPHGICVNAIAPGGITTEGVLRSTGGSGMTEEQMRAMTEELIGQIPLRRMGVPDDIAKAAIFLASQASDYMAGETVIVDGGRLLG
jgi:2-dehydro-3-deoxy-D-gluconate 5-dehydrogenase